MEERLVSQHRPRLIQTRENVRPVGLLLRLSVDINLFVECDLVTGVNMNILSHHVIMTLGVTILNSPDTSISIRNSHPGYKDEMWDEKLLIKWGVVPCSL